METVDTKEVFEFGKDFFGNKLKELVFTEDMIHLLLNIILCTDSQDAMIEKAKTYLKKCGFLDCNNQPTEHACHLSCSNQFIAVK